MKTLLRATVIMALLLISEIASAGWTQIAHNGSSIAYFDPSTVRRDGGKAKMWNLADFKNGNAINGTPYMSMKSQLELDCKEEQSRTLFVSFHSGSMGGGEFLLSSNTPSDWSPVAPDSLTAIMLETVCGKR